ncbi:hypothetical protein BH09SUM1_BH09SUM1_22500 [soil metagenome]
MVSRVFNQDEVSVGRSSTNDICPDPMIYNQVSRRHGRALRVGRGNFVYEDLQSTQGSWYDGDELKKNLILRRGDSVTLGKDGPAVAFSWAQERITGHGGTHYRQRSRPSPSFPLVFSPAFFGRFSSYEKIAAGGFGEVWRGNPTDGSAALAIKLMHPQLLDPANLAKDDRDSLISRFAREARLTNQLSLSGAPNIPKVHSWGDDADKDYIYIVMDMIEGVSFDQLIHPKQPMPVDRAAQTMYQVARALDAAHNFEFVDESGIRARGVIHRDVKPNNILIEAGTNRTWVVDFGVAGFQEGGDRLTSTNITVGTYQFLPPESIESNVVSPATDLWGFTVTLYLALSGGRFPYQGSERMEILRILKAGEITPIGAYRQDLPASIHSAVDRSLNTDATQRVQSAQEWMQILKPYAE